MQKKQFRNKMKRVLYFIAALLLATACSDGRENILKVYNWADYIDEELLVSLSSGMKNRQVSL